MKQFKAVRPHVDVIARLEAGNWVIDDSSYSEDGDFIFLKDEHDCKRIMWNAFNGHFHGTFIGGRIFDHTSSQFDGEGWYQEILNIFYMETEHAE